MRALKGLFCAAVLTACLAPGIRADEYTKQTFLTFSGPVQLPGITLPAGTYQFRLADPEMGRSTLQVWDKDGSKLYTTLLTIPDQRMTATDEPVVMFSERASGEAQPIRAWFYPNETYGQEFVYPKDQAMRIAKESHSSVLSFNDDAKDASMYKSAKVGRMDENGQMTDADKDAASATTASTTTADHDAQSASTQAAASNTAAQSSTAQSDASLSTPARSTTDQAAAEPQATSPTPSANRSDASTPVGTSGTASTASSAATTTSEATKDNVPTDRAVGTTGSTTNANSANRTGQAASGANAAAPQPRSQAPSTNQARSANQPPSGNQSGAAQTTANDNARALPRTAGSMTLVQLLAGLSLAGAFALRMFRRGGAHSN